MQNHEIDYKIIGEEMQCVEIELDPNETVIAEAGGLMYMNSNIEMNTIFGDGSNQDSGIFGKLLSGAKRVLTGESLFMTTYTHRGSGKSHVSFASPYPGKIIPLNLENYGGKIICQKYRWRALSVHPSRSQSHRNYMGIGYDFMASKGIMYRWMWPPIIWRMCYGIYQRRGLLG